MADHDTIDADQRVEWREALDDIVAAYGPDAAADLLAELQDHGRRRGVRNAALLHTPYVNTLSPAQERPYPGDLKVEERIAAYLRWNAMAMVVRANKRFDGIGGHLSTYASALTLWEVGFHHFFRGRGMPGETAHPGDQVFFQGHAAPGIYARAYLEGRLSETNLDLFRREVAGEGAGLSSYPHPRSMPQLWEFPTVSMGIGPLNAVHQARVNRYLSARGIVDATAARVWAFVGDGETDEPETLAAIRLAAREGLDNLTFVVNANLQRLDGPVRGNTRIIDELEGVFVGAGWNVLKVLWASEWDRLLSSPAGGALAARLGGFNDGELQLQTVMDAPELRAALFGGDPALEALGATLGDAEILGLRRGGHDPVKVHAAYAAAVAHTGSPTVILAQTVKGYALGPNFAGRNATHQIKKMTPDQMRIFRDALDIPVDDDDLAGGLPPYLPLPPAEREYLLERRRALGGVLPRRPDRPATVAMPSPAAFAEFDAGSPRAVSTTMAYTRLVRSLLRDPAIGRRVVPIVPDEGRTFGFESLYSEFGLYSPGGQRYTPVDHDLPISYKEAADGAFLQVGINEAGGVADLTAAGTSGATWGEATIPFYTLYSMFGFQRAGDLLWAFGDARGRGFLAAATAGRTTLLGEGVQHTDGHSHVLAGTVPSCRAYDPAFAYETSAVVRRGIEEMFADGAEVFYYLTLYNENYRQPAKPADSGVAGVTVDEAITAGAHRVLDETGGRVPQMRLLASGPAVNAALEAADRLHEEGVAVEVWSVTSFSELRREALDAEAAGRRSFLDRAFADPPAPVVAVTDYVRSVPDQIARFLPGAYRSLGTDGWGVSDTREALRQHFGVDTAAILTAARELLAPRLPAPLAGRAA